MANYKIKFPLLLVATIFWGGLFLEGCKKMVAVDIPKNQKSASTVFNTNVTANAAVQGMYSTLSQSSNFVFNGNTTIFMGLSSDEFYYTSSQASYDQFTANTISTINNPDNLSLWSNPYSIIVQANDIIEGLASKGSLVTDSLKKQYTAEAKFVRAFAHFYLTNMYGKVPVIMTSDYTVSAIQPRASVEDVYAQIISDLTDAESNLANDYKYSPTAGDRTRVNKWAAAALLARVYLYRGQWDMAVKQASLIIGNVGLYSLVPDISTGSPFFKNSTEAIWQYYSFQAPTSGYTREGSTLAPTATATACFALRDTLLHTFEAGDKRRINWVTSFTPVGSATAYSVPYKYKNNSTILVTGSKLEFYTPLRLAEQYLIRAEALAHVGDLAGATADLNVIRRRAGLNSVAPSDVNSLLSAIAKERQVELFAEMGHRWMDLKRTNTANAVLSMIKLNTWKPTAVLYPVPEEASKSNTSLLPQNDGY